MSETLGKDNPPPDIGVVLTMMRPEEKSLVQALEEAGLAVTIALDRNGVQSMNGRASLPRLALIRSLSHETALMMATMLDYAGVKTINSARAIHLCSNKALQALEFQKRGVPYPDFRISFNVQDVQRDGEELGGDYVIKPLSSSWGRGIARVRCAEAFESWAAGLESTDARGRAFPVLTQRYIEKNHADIRVVVVGDDPVVAFRRVAEHWKTNTHLGARVEPIAVTPRIREIIAPIVAILGDGFYGIDLFEETSTGRLLVCEVNHNPEFDKSSRVHGVAVSRLVAAFIKRTLGTTTARQMVSSNL